jgi:hypothetical protein
MSGAELIRLVRSMRPSVRLLHIVAGKNSNDDTPSALLNLRESFTVNELVTAVVSLMGRPERGAGRIGSGKCPNFLMGDRRPASTGSEGMADDWARELERLEERAAKHRAKAKEQDDEVQKAIREAEERRRTDKAADESEGPKD